MPRKPHPLLAAVDALGLAEIGRSSRGRPIGAARFGPDGGAAVQRVLVVAGVHGDEPSTVEAAIDLCAVLAATPPARAAVTVVPVLNPDGLALGRKNTARNVDLNRNFPAASFTLDHRPGYFPGERPLSEPEARCLTALVDRERPTHVCAVHAPLGCVNHDGPSRAWAAAVAAACGWPLRADIGYPTPGSLGGFLGVDRGLPVLTLELPPGPLASFAESARAALLAAVNPPGMG